MTAVIRTSTILLASLISSIELVAREKLFVSHNKSIVKAPVKKVE